MNYLDDDEDREYDQRVEDEITMDSIRAHIDAAQQRGREHAREIRGGPTGDRYARAYGYITGLMRAGQYDEADAFIAEFDRLVNESLAARR